MFAESIFVDNDTFSFDVGFYQFDDSLLRVYLSLPKNEFKNNNSSTYQRSLFVLDYSASMSHDWSQIQKAISYFSENKGYDDNKTDFIVYNGQSRLSNVNEILKMNASGCTSFGAAFDQIEKYMKNLVNRNDIDGELESQVVNVIFMTDGQDNRTNDINQRVSQFEDFINNKISNSIKVIIHTIGFTSDHDRNLLEKLCNLSKYSKGIYRFADNKNNNNKNNKNSKDKDKDNENDKGDLTDKFEEMFDFLATSNSIELLIDNKIKITTDLTQGIVDGDIYEIDLITNLNDQTKIKENVSQSHLFKKIANKGTISVCRLGKKSRDYQCEFRPCDELFVLKQIECMEIKNEDELDKCQLLLNSIKIHKIRNKNNKIKGEFLKYLIQLKLNKYYDIFSQIKRGLIKNDDSTILSELNSLRYETTFSKARQQRAMNKRIIKNMNQFSEIENKLEKLQFPPSKEIMNKLFSNDANIKNLKCLLSNDTIFDIMQESNDNIMVFTLNIIRAEHLIDAPTSVFIKKYLIGYYSFEAIKNATRFAIDENGTNQALGGFVKSKQFKYKYGGGVNKNNNNNNDDENKDDNKNEEQVGLFRGCDGIYPNAYLPLYLNSEHFKRVEILLKPILGYFFTLDPLGFMPNQYMGLYYILGHMLCTQKNGDDSEWFKWLVTDFSMLCQHLLPTVIHYLTAEKNGILSNCIKSGDLLNEWINNENIRFSKAIVQNLLFLVGLYHCQSAVTLPNVNVNVNLKKIDNYEFEIKFIQELWRRNFGVYYKNIPKLQVDQVLDSLLFDFNTGDDNKENDAKNEEQANDKLKQQLEEEEKKYEQYAKFYFKIDNVEGDYSKVKFAKIDDLIQGNNDNNDHGGGLKSKFESHYDILIDFDKLTNASLVKMNQILDKELAKIASLNQFVNKFFNGKPVNGENVGLKGKLRWLMIIQALRFHRYNANSNSNNNNDGGDNNNNNNNKSKKHLCAFECLVKKRFSIKRCLGDYIEYKDKKMKEKSESTEFNKSSFNKAKYIVENSDNIFSFIGKLLCHVPTRGGKLFNHIIGLMMNENAIKLGEISLYEEKLAILMHGKYLDKYNVISNGTAWIHCGLNIAAQFKSIVGNTKWDKIEKPMIGIRSGWVYRSCDKPNRHGHCNSNPNPKLVTVFKGFGV